MKKLITLLLALAMLFSLCACGNTEKVCPECNGAKTVACSVCSGSGKVECPEDDCDNGVLGVSCTNCGGREEIIVCTKCDGEQKETRTCETCGGDGIIVNPVTWEKFECGNCEGLGQAVYTCSRCCGYGLICTYCRSNAVNYPSEEFHPYYIECETCSGTGMITCVNCQGAKEIPCPACSEAEYQAFMSNLEAEKDAKNNAEKDAEIVENVKSLLSGITADDMSYNAKPFDQETLQVAKELLTSYEGEFDEKSKFLEQIEQITPYVDSTWELVDGMDTRMFNPTTLNSIQYKFQVTYSRDKEAFYIRVIQIDSAFPNGYNSKVFYAQNQGENIFEYYWDGANEAYEVYLTESGNLSFVQYEKPVNGVRTDTVVDSCELKKLD